DDSAARAALRAVAEASWPPTRVILRVILIILFVAVAIWVLVKLTGVILLLILSIFFAYLVAPLVDFLRRPVRIGKRQYALPRTASIAFAYLVIIAAIIIAMLFLVPRLVNQFPEFANQARGYWKTLGDKAQRINDYVRIQSMPGPVVDAISRA